MFLIESRKCYVRLGDKWKSRLEAELIGFMFSEKPYESSIYDGHTITQTTDALVMLLTFDVGRIYQLPLHLVKCVNKFERETE